MRMIALTVAGLLAAGALAPAPAEAQRHGWNGDRGWRGGWDRGWRGHDRRWNHRGWNRDWRGGYRPGWGYRPRPRLVCQMVPGYWGPVRRCFRVWR